MRTVLFRYTLFQKCLNGRDNAQQRLSRFFYPDFIDKNGLKVYIVQNHLLNSKNEHCRVMLCPAVYHGTLNVPAEDVF